MLNAIDTVTVSDAIAGKIDDRKALLAVRVPLVMQKIEQAFAPLKPIVEARLKQSLTDTGSRRGKFVKINEILSDVRDISSTFAACGAGCSACCTQRVMMSQTEAEAIGHKISRKPVQLRPSYVLPEIDTFGSETPCTFLSNNVCTIYEHRPFACRNLVNLDVDPLLCRFENWELSKAKDARSTGIPLLSAGPLEQAYSSLSGRDMIGDIRAFFPISAC
ncbi:YkgJ family cysteine cluster protein [Massilia sp. TWP1-3-3]|uniref:YkgJ family cysteine cluster protein n=1 Tax=Massilia sp. TWP1-3-3 TaxID=2804573 RepID=UPI003CE9F24F